MREIDPDLAAHIAGGVTTLCRCWRVTRSDGVVLGFTDHDRTLSFGGDDYEPTSGFDASEDVSATGFAVGGMEVSGALSSDRLDADDLASGRYDNAEVRIYLVNWSTPSERQLLRVGHIGEVTREDGAFRAEVRGLAASLDETKGRAFRPACDADVGDARCGVDLDDPAFKATGAVTAVGDRRQFTASGLGGFDAGWFDRGRFTWTSGANAGRGAEVRSHRKQAERDGRAVAADVFRHRSRRCLHHPGRLRQALRDLSPEVRQHHQLPWLSPHAGERFRPVLRARRR